MAEGGFFPNLGTEQDLVCSICLEEYEDPRALPCLHTFCYKCLVQLNKKTQEEIWVPVSTVQKQENILKCPICKEEHPVPKLQGVDGFRKDFKMNTLVDQHKMKSIDVTSKTKTSKMKKAFQVKSLVKFFERGCNVTSKTDQNQKIEESISIGDHRKFLSDQCPHPTENKIEESVSTRKHRIGGSRGTCVSSQEHPEVPSEKCLYHPKENLLYHCESQTCQYDICKECWGSKHDSHVVKLLSMKVNGTKDALLQQMENNIFQVSSQIDVLSETKDNTSAQDKEIAQEMKQKYSEMQEQLQNTYKQTIQQFNMHKMLQEKKISDELDRLISLQQTFTQIKNGIDKENLSPTSRTFMKYEGMQDKIQGLTENITNWDFSYTKAELPVHEFQIPISVAYKKTTIDPKDEEEYDEDYNQFPGCQASTSRMQLPRQIAGKIKNK